MFYFQLAVHSSLLGPSIRPEKLPVPVFYCYYQPQTLLSTIRGCYLCLTLLLHKCGLKSFSSTMFVCLFIYVVGLVPAPLLHCLHLDIRGWYLKPSLGLFCPKVHNLGPIQMKLQQQGANVCFFRSLEFQDHRPHRRCLFFKDPSIFLLGSTELYGYYNLANVQ